MPNVVVTELEIYYNNSGNKLRAATFGRGLWETDISTPLPVELSAFTANVSGGSVVLNWTTDTEVNNYGFEIERQKSDVSVQNSDPTASSNWNKIGFVAGAGNSNSTKQYSYEDKNISSGQYYYRLKQIDIDGQFKYSGVAEVTANYIPEKYALMQNYPNPFNPSTTIPYQIKDKGFVQIKIYNLLGQEISTLVNEVKAGGAYTAVFDAKGLPSGVYYYSLSVNDFVQSKKMILLR